MPTLINLIHIFSKFLILDACSLIFLQNLDDDDFSDIARHGIIEVVGDDVAGRKVIVISACRLPGNKNFDHQRFLR